MIRICQLWLSPFDFISITWFDKVNMVDHSLPEAYIILSEYMEGQF